MQLTELSLDVKVIGSAVAYFFAVIILGTSTRSKVKF